jgi:hypothetical protein
MSVLQSPISPKPENLSENCDAQVAAMQLISEAARFELSLKDKA